MDRSMYTQSGDLVWYNGILYEVGVLKDTDVILPISAERPMQGQDEPVVDVLRIPADKAFFAPYINNKAPYRSKEKRTWDQILLLSAIRMGQPLAYTQDLAKAGVTAIHHLQKQKFFRVDLSNLKEENPWVGTDFDLMCDIPTKVEINRRFDWASEEELQWVQSLATCVSASYRIGTYLKDEFKSMSKTITLEPA